MFHSRKDTKPEEQLSQLFGSYKAEWLKEQLYELFSEPEYFPELMTSRPCMLVGGRGTGKTTVLKSLSYEGQFALSARSPKKILDWKYIGLYYRVNTNRVTAFRGPELPEDRWVKVFGHYFNLLLCEHFVRFLSWYQIQTSLQLHIEVNQITKVVTTLHFSPAGSIGELAESIDKARLTFEAYVNNVADQSSPPLSMLGAPVDLLSEIILNQPDFVGKQFFILLDEYENFEDYQQQVVNTLVKHSGSSYTFKIGVRELGHRRRATLNENEQLISPADYVKINIVDKLEGERFKAFAKSVCNERLARLESFNETPIPNIETCLSSLSEDQEADVLGVSSHAAKPQTSEVAAVTHG
jgi:hypothetical protein